MYTPFGSNLLDNEQYLRKALKQPYAVVEDALVPDLAEELYEELLACPAWSAEDRGTSFRSSEQRLMSDDYSFTRDSFRMDSPEAPESVRRLNGYLNSTAALDWISSLSGRRCTSFAGSCARYTGGNHLTSHNDLYSVKTVENAVITRTVTFNYYLTKGWHSEWGGNFVWEKGNQVIAPKFNMLVLFQVNHFTDHHVQAVSDAATVPRLALTGWFLTTRRSDERRLNLYRG